MRNPGLYLAFVRCPEGVMVELVQRGVKADVGEGFRASWPMTDAAFYVIYAYALERALASLRRINIEEAR